MTKNIWSIDMKSFLNSLNYYKKKLIEKNIMQIDEIKLLKYSKRYDEILSKGLNQNENISSK
ncbi:MAG: hypothetical protein RSF67_09405, partial [Clostridia bacterium]